MTEVEKETIRKRKRRAKKTQACLDLHGDKCADCEKTYPNICYDFHHVEPKTVEVSRMVHKDMKLELILEEARKCVLLCSNCHRIRHSIGNPID